MAIKPICLFAGLRFHEYVLFPAPFRPLLPRIPGVHHCPPHATRSSSGRHHSHLADEADCGAFYHCQPAGIFGTLMVRKRCGVGLMFNIETGEGVGFFWPNLWAFLNVLTGSIKKKKKK
jgi:hypothetical protein